MFWWVTLDAPFGGTRSPWVVLGIFFSHISILSGLNKKPPFNLGWSQKKARNLRGNRFPVAARANILTSSRAKLHITVEKTTMGTTYMLYHMLRRKSICKKPSFWGYRLIFNGAPSFCGRWISKYKTIGSQIFRRTYPSWQPMKIESWKMKFPLTCHFQGTCYFFGGMC